MRTRTHSWPDGHWDWYRHLAFQHGVRVGDLLFVGGQVDKTPRGEPLHHEDLATQTAVNVGHIDTVLRGLEADLGDVVWLTAFYRQDGSVDEAALLADIGSHVSRIGGLGTGEGPVITLVPLPWLALPGMVVEIEAVAMRGADGVRIPRTGVMPAGLPGLPAPFVHGVRCGEMLFTSGQDGAGSNPAAAADALERVATVLESLGGTLDDAVRLDTWYRGDDSPGGFGALARGLAGGFEDGAAPVHTALPTPGLPAATASRIGAWAMRATGGGPLPRRSLAPPPDDGWQWPATVPFPIGLACGGLVFLGGQVPLDEHGGVLLPGELVEQTRLVMERTRRLLEAAGLGIDHMVKQNSYYLGGSAPEAIVANQTLRSSYYREPAGTSTGVPLAAFPLPEISVSVTTVAME